MIRKTSVLIILFIIIGCTFKPRYIDLPSDELITLGSRLTDEGRYRDAINYFQSAVINSYHPDEAETAQRLKAEAYFRAKLYIDAIAAYEAYAELYTSKGYTTDMLYKVAYSYYALSLAPGRDQTFSEKSLSYFDMLKELYPDFYIESGSDKLRMEVLNKIAKSEYDIGVFYLRKDEYGSAIFRFLSVISNYSESDYVSDAYENLIHVAKKSNHDIELINIYESEYEHYKSNNYK